MAQDKSYQIEFKSNPALNNTIYTKINTGLIVISRRGGVYLVILLIVIGPTDKNDNFDLGKPQG